MKLILKFTDVRRRKFTSKFKIKMALFKLLEEDTTHYIAFKKTNRSKLI